MEDQPTWQYVAMLIAGIALGGLGILWYREHWSDPAAAQGGQQGAAGLSAWGSRFGRSAYRGVAAMFGLLIVSFVVFPAGSLATASSAEGTILNVVGSWLTGLGALAFAASFLVWITSFLVGRPHFLLPPGLRGQPGFPWDRAPTAHRAWIARAEPSDGPAYFAAFCNCGWMDVPHGSAEEARATALEHTPKVRMRIEYLPEPDKWPSGLPVWHGAYPSEREADGHHRAALRGRERPRRAGDPRHLHR